MRTLPSIAILILLSATASGFAADATTTKAATKPADVVISKTPMNGWNIPGATEKDVAAKYAAFVNLEFTPNIVGGFNPVATQTNIVPGMILNGSGLHLDILKGALKDDPKLLSRLRYNPGNATLVVVLADSSDDAIKDAQKVYAAIEQWWPVQGPEILNAVLVAGQKQLDAAQKKLVDVKKTLDNERMIFGGFDPTRNTIDQIQVQVLMVDVDLAGVRARIEAAGAILKEMSADAPAERRARTETIRTEAQVELAGLLAQKSALERILQTYKKVSSLQTEHAQTEAQVESMKRPQEMLQDILKSKFAIRQTRKLEVYSLYWPERPEAPVPGYGGGYGDSFGSPGGGSPGMGGAGPAPAPAAP